MGTIGLNKNYFCFSFSTRPKDFDMMRLIATGTSLFLLSNIKTGITQFDFLLNLELKN